MCISEIDPLKTKQFKHQTEPIIAYKLVEKTADKKIYPLYNHKKKPFKLGKNKALLKRTKYYTNPITNKKSFYTAGIHAYLNLAETKRIRNCYSDDIDNSLFNDVIIIKVYIQPNHVLYVGEQGNKQVIVAKEITIKSLYNVR